MHTTYTFSNTKVTCAQHTQMGELWATLQILSSPVKELVLPQQDCYGCLKQLLWLPNKMAMATEPMLHST